MRKNSLLLQSLFVLLFVAFTNTIYAVDTSSLAPMHKIDVGSSVISIEKLGVAGIYANDPHFVRIKRIDNPGQTPNEVDLEHQEAKDKISIANFKRGNRRNSVLSDSLMVELGYQSNPFGSSTPMDNHCAISNEGVIVSVVNTNMLITDSLGNTLQFRNMNAAFFGDNSLTASIYDPKILYDPDLDRFILVILHGSNSTTSRVLLMFSKSNRPDIDGWNYYKLIGNAFNNGLWFDYPNIGINKNDLFITGNLFDNNNAYNNKVIFQVSKTDGYDGVQSIGSRVWGGSFGSSTLRNDDNNIPFTIVPAPNGFANDQNEDMYFVSTNSNSGNKIYIYRITAALNNNPTFEISSVSIPVFIQERLVSQLQIINGNGDPIASSIRLIAGDARMKNAYIQNGVIHCVWNARPAQTQFLRINYARIDVKSNVVLTSSFSDNSHDYAFAAVAPFSNNPENPTALIVYTSSSAVKFPDIGVLTCNKDMEFSNPVLVKEGESFVTFLQSNSSTRWGDYSGIAKKYNATKPEIWISASYGGNSSGIRHWKNWNAKIVSVEEEIITFGETKLFPNPIFEPAQAVTFNFIAEEAGEYTVKVFDMTGRLVRDIFTEQLLSGEHRFTFSTSGYAIGSYIVRYYYNGKPLGFEKMLVITN